MPCGALPGPGASYAGKRCEPPGESEGSGRRRPAGFRGASGGGKAVMNAWKRWQDYVTMVFGVVVFISPLVFGETSHHAATLGAYVLGALLVVAGIVAAYTREGRASLFVNAPGIVSVITFVAGIVLLFSGATAIALTAGLMAILTVLVGATFRMGARTESKAV